MSMLDDVSVRTDERLMEISSLLASYSTGDFDAKGQISENFDALDTIISGINMLGEEIKDSTISRDFMVSVYKAVQDLLFTISTDKEITDCNNAAERALGLNKNQLFSKKLTEFFDFDKENLANYEYLFEQGLFSGTGKTIEGTFKNASGQLRYVVCEVSILMAQKSTPEGYLVLIRDVTNKKLADRILLRAMVSTLEEERKRVANDLHDSIGQELAGLRIILSHLLNVSQKANVIKKQEMDTCITLIDETIQGLRNVCYNLLPSSLLNEGLISAVNELKRRMPAEVIVEFAPHDVVKAFPLSLQVDLFRIIQEFITNSLKHARAETINISFDLNDQGIVEMELRDDGVGFDPNERSIGGRGLYTIGSRAKTFNGTVSLTSSRGDGTRLFITFNLESYEEYSTFDR